MKCAICTEPISPEDQRYRHVEIGPDGSLVTMHENCCIASGPCHQRLDPYNLHKGEQ